MKLAAIYARYSSERQSDKSNEDQIAEAEVFCKQNNFNIVKVYQDKEITGWSDESKRPGLNELLKDLPAHDFEYLILWKLNRLARDSLLQKQLKRRIRDSGVEIISISQQLPKDRRARMLLETFTEFQDEDYSWSLAEDSMRGMMAAVRRGEFAGKDAPFGYKAVYSKKGKRTLVIDERTGPVAREMFERFSKGETAASIARWLNRSGHRSTHNNPFTSDSVYRILKNEFYKGVLVFNNSTLSKRGRMNPYYEVLRVDHSELILVCPELWEAVQKKRTSSRGRRPRRTYFLSKAVVCSHCGRFLTRRASGKKKDRKKQSGASWYCQNCTSNGYSSKTVGEKKLEGAVKSFLRSVIEAFLQNAEDFTKKLNLALERKKIEASNTSTLEQSLASLDERIDNILSAIEQGQGIATLTRRLSDLEQQKVKLAQKIKQTKAAAKTIKLLTPEEIRANLELYEKYLDDPEQQNKVLRAILSKCVMDLRTKTLTICAFGICDKISF